MVTGKHSKFKNNMYSFRSHSTLTREPGLPKSPYPFETLGCTYNPGHLSAPESLICFHRWQGQTQEWYKSKRVLKAQEGGIRTSVLVSLNNIHYKYYKLYATVQNQNTVFSYLPNQKMSNNLKLGHDF